MADGGDARALPLGWEERLSRSTGEVYYLNLLTNEIQENFPEQPADAGYVRPEGSIQCSHILVKHCESRRPFSWRLGLNKKIKRTRDEALKYIEFCRGVILTGRKTFEQMAEEYSDCVSAKRKGDLYVIRRGDTQKPFEAAAFALNVGELSEPVFTESGVHLIKRTA